MESKTIAGSPAPAEAPATEEAQADAPAVETAPETPAQDDAEGEPSVTAESQGQPADEAGDESPAGDEAADEEPEESGPVEYDLQLPNGVQGEQAEAHVVEVESFARAHQLSPDQAQAVLDRDLARHQEQVTDWFDRSSKWKAQVVADPEFGGDNFARTQQLSKEVTSAYFGARFADMLERTGFGNEPDFVKGTARIGADLAEANKLVGGRRVSGSDGPTRATLFDKSPEMDSMGG